MPKSPMRATTARGVLTRRTLLKPGLPEPTVRMSMPLPIIARTEKGIAPTKKQPSILSSVSRSIMGSLNVPRLLAVCSLMG